MTADLFFDCAVENACLSGYFANGSLVPPGKCATGSRGNLCGNCEEGLNMKVNSKKCAECAEGLGEYVLPGILLLVSLLLLFNTVKTEMELTKKVDIGQATENKEVLGGVLMKNLVNYVQIISLIGSFPLRWTDSMQKAADIPN